MDASEINRADVAAMALPLKRTRPYRPSAASVPLQTLKHYPCDLTLGVTRPSVADT